MIKNIKTSTLKISIHQGLKLVSEKVESCWISFYKSNNDIDVIFMTEVWKLKRFTFMFNTVKHFMLLFPSDSYQVSNI